MSDAPLLAPRPSALDRVMHRATLLLAAVSAVSLVLMLALVFVSVIFRYLLATPILGVNEIVQLASVAVVMLALPYCTAQNGHVGVDVLDEAIGAAGRYIGDIQSRILSGVVLAVLVQRAALKALDAREFGDATNMLNLPLWPFYAFIAAGMALCVLILLAQLVVLLLQKVRP
ncbi:TRAP transporter small permease [Phaeovulum sp. W22_SRMD_FR3]|uniref:TRAP transporter small permease n=1 Tax=Phaeovulum sp. W22_SRMD_FR3 TaxID=3240274 RepID=UPI003F9A173B